MSDLSTPTPSEDLSRIIASAGRLGVEMDQNAALKWLTAMAAPPAEADVAMDVRSGVFGHRTSLLDFDDTRLEHFRKIGRLVEFADVPGKVETALALSGSAAQSKIQTYPGDCDFFERVNILASTREDACRILGELMREKAMTTEHGETHQLIEVKYGSCPRDIVIDGKTLKVGAPISWTVQRVRDGRIKGTTVAGEPDVLFWDEVGGDPGWCKLDWVVADPPRGELANASNMLDATWEAPDGTITPLDGHLDPYFQEVYLEAASVPIFAKISRHVAGDALDTYVEQLEGEILKYVTKSPNYGKAAKRMYNVFRMTGRYEEAAYLRELFDEPATALYQVWSVIRTLDDVITSGADSLLDTMQAQADRLLATTMEVLDDAEHSKIVRRLRRFNESIDVSEGVDNIRAYAESARDELINAFFQERLMALPSIEAYIAGITDGEPQKSA